VLSGGAQRTCGLAARSAAAARPDAASCHHVAVVDRLRKGFGLERLAVMERQPPGGREVAELPSGGAAR
jgi:hypothetical protein